MEIDGIIVSGTGKGSYFMSLEVYKNQFVEKLGFKPYPGTLNLKIKEKDSSLILGLNEKMGVMNGVGKYGDVKFLLARLNGEIKGALLFPAKTQHSKQVLEFVAGENLREKLKIKDGSLVHLEIICK